MNLSPTETDIFEAIAEMWFYDNPVRIYGL